MAERRVSLKYLDGGGDLYPQGYIDLTDRLFVLNATEYQNLETKTPAYNWVTNNNAQPVYEIVEDTAGTITPTQITFNKYRIMCKIDKDAMDNDKMRRRSHVSLPRIQPKTAADIDYLADYLEKLKTMPTDQAVKFLFGMLLITKCR